MAEPARPRPHGSLRDLLQPESPLRSSTWDAPAASFRTFASADEVPAKLEPRAEDAFLVPDFELAELLVARGARSARVAVDLAGDPAAWVSKLSQTEVGAAIAPPRPYSFGERVLVVLPTYNERENIGQMVAALVGWLDCEVLVVDDGSPDGTGEIADRLHEGNARVHVLHRPAKEGLGKAYLAGFAWALDAGFARICQIDCDFSHAPWDLPRLVAACGDADLAIGSRYVAGGKTDGWTRSRRMLSRCANLYTRCFLGRGVRDWTAGFRCWRADLLASMGLESVAASGYCFQIEMAWRTLKLGGRVRELPIHFVDRGRGTSKMSKAIALEALRRVPLLRVKV